ncbi:MAG TPA: O-antigen ligase family protein, partial [Lacipirellulaceae bacterium]|nr:O-antigen ligase family protein [Lacipirellulaceae bacterium]
SQLLPLWNSTGAGAASFGPWRTLSLIPHETMKSLAMVLSYGLLFVVVIGRIEDKADAERLLQGIALAAVLMAVFGLLHYATTDGRFFWFYWYPHRWASRNISGPFINRNHFADFLVLGVGPLLAWLLNASKSFHISRSRSKSSTVAKDKILFWALGSAASLIAMTILLSRSRGGAIALLVCAGTLLTIYLCRGLADRRAIYGLAGLAAVVVALLSINGYDKVAQRLDDFTEGSLDDLDQGGMRRTLWAANISAFEAGWLTGAGAGSHLEMCPIYLPKSYTKEYTHAENGYLQIASENGIGGIVLLCAGLLMCGTWCVGGLVHSSDLEIVRLLGAATAGLAASAIHSIVDFVWYIPACISITIILAACALRLSQLARPADARASFYRVLKRGRWVELAAAALLIGGWAVHTFVGPGMAAIYWERYRRAAVANSQLSQEQLSALVDNKPVSLTAEQNQLNETMMHELEQVVHWDPDFARAHLCLAAKYIAQFDIVQQQSPNAMGFGDVRETLTTTSFASTRDRQAWLNRAFGSNLAWLRRAAEEARTAAILCPLQGKAYIYLAQLCPLNGPNAAVENAYIDQGLRVRPSDAEVLFEVGRQDYVAGNLAKAIDCWKKCFDDIGPHQLKIVYLLSGRLSAEKLLEILEPDWHTLRTIWTRYRELGRPEDSDAILAYAANCAEHNTSEKGDIPPAYVWFWQAQFYADADRTDDALKSLQRAYMYSPQSYFIRLALARAFQAAGKYAEAEPHFRWCMARRPDDRSLRDALLDISKQRLAQREQMIESAQQVQAANAAAQIRPPESTLTLPQSRPAATVQPLSQSPVQSPAPSTLLQPGIRSRSAISSPK